MATSPEQAVRHARNIEKQLSPKFAEHHVPNAEILALLAEYRFASLTAFSSDLQHALDHGIEDQLWEAHVSVNNRFRKQLSQLRKAGKHKVVEIRKLARTYLEFIKNSQRFYREYVLLLDKRYGGISELRQVAVKWKQDASSAFGTQTETAQVSAALRQRVLRSCYTTLIRLGDLSRYREAELSDKDRKDWGPAIGYYGLATELLPDSGMSHNQQAVIALADGNHLRATYHLYRSLSVAEPHPLAKQNLEVEFKKIVQAWDKGELINNQGPRDANGADKALIAWFVRLHSKCYKGEDFAGHDELENEVMTQLTLKLKERTLEGTLHKFIIINLAAEHFASAKLQDGERSETTFKSYFFFLRLNIRTFLTLLQLIKPELEYLTSEDVKDQAQEQSLPDRISAVARRILPGLRLYSSWFLTNWRVLAAKIGDLPQEPRQELWTAYSATLTLLAASFPAQELPGSDYMLEEDVDTIGFKPLMSENTMKTWYGPAQTLKPRVTQDGIERHHPNTEMLIRVRDFLVDGLHLAMDPDAPINLVGMRFIYADADAVPDTTAGANTPAPPAMAVPQPQLEVQPVPAPDTVHKKKGPASIAPSESSISKDAAMTQMVDDLLGEDDGLDPLVEDDENLPPTPPTNALEDNTVVNDSAYGLGSLAAAGDIVNMAQGLSTSNCTLEAHNITSSPSLRQLAALPSLPDQSTIWRRDAVSSGPSSPYLPQGPPSRGSPLNPNAQPFGHSRVQSSTSIRSSTQAHDGWGSFNVTPVQPPPGFENGRPAQNSHRMQGWNQYSPNPDDPWRGNTANYNPGHTANAQSADMGMLSPFLFGANSGPWSSGSSRRTGSFGMTPPNGQGG